MTHTRARASSSPAAGGSPKVFFGEHDHLIRSARLFANLDLETLEPLLRHAQIRHFSKNALLLMERETPDRLYLILKGWVKVFRGTAGGDEIILQMLSPGSTVMESAVFLNAAFPAGAQAAEKVTVLSFPAPKLREYVKNHPPFLLNLLHVMSQGTESLFDQVETTRAKQADDRVGWFLLKLLLERGRQSAHVALPYDKNLIASYLGMTRETFSRVLTRLKKKGFQIEKNTVIIPQLEALCGFCDSSVAHTCPRSQTPECPYTES
jgi:CRP-like cAMP-binding protein